MSRLGESPLSTRQPNEALRGMRRSPRWLREDRRRDSIAYALAFGARIEETVRVVANADKSWRRTRQASHSFPGKTGDPYWATWRQEGRLALGSAMGVSFPTCPFEV